MDNNKVTHIYPWIIHELDWCAYMSDRKGKIYKIFLKPDGQEIDVEYLNVVVHENGIEFLED